MFASVLLSLVALAQAPTHPAGTRLEGADSAGTNLERASLQRAVQEVAARDARALGVGAWVPDADGETLDGAARSWRSEAGDRGTVLALVSLTCPLCQKFAPELARVEARARAVGFGFVHVALDPLDTADALRAHVARLGLEGAVLRDVDGALARALDAHTTTEVFVVDERGTLRYRGAVNDQYGIGFALDEPRHTYLDDALRHLIRGTEPDVVATTAPGCVVERAPHRAAAGAGPSDGTVTYSREVARFMQTSCVECHRAGGVAPFALDTYDAVARRATMLQAVIDDGVMPPWFAAHQGAGASPWANDRSLLARERALLADWIAAGKPRGDDAELPLPRAFGAAGWKLGEPDAVYALPRDFRVPAEGRVEYQYNAVPTGLTEDRWVRAIEVRPGAVEVVHHVLAYALPAEAFEDGRLRRWDLLDERRGFFAAWAPGSEPVVYPEGQARELRAGTVLMFELHYTPNGTATLDRSAIGVHFASADPAWRPERVVRTAGISNRRIRIPAGASGHLETSTGVIARAMEVQAFMPHMHLRGAAFRFDRVDAAGARSTLLDVPRYDFNWQLRYELVTPVVLSAGEQIDIAGVFDNSAGNRANPAPDRSVKWGPETQDEMLIGFVDYVLVDEDHDLSSDEPQLVVLDSGMQRQLRELAAQNNGVLGRDQLPRRARAEFEKLDRDGNGALDAQELPLLARDGRGASRGTR
ncbi:MAG: redoxin family protein [Planctomycetota bacterium]